MRAAKSRPRNRRRKDRDRRAAVDVLELVTRGRDQGARSLIEGLTGSLGRMAEFAGGTLIAGGLSRIADSFRGVAGAMVSGNAEFERYETQFGVLLRATDSFKAATAGITDPLQQQAVAVQMAKDRIAELSDFAAKTPFELPDVVRADKILQGFGLHSAEAAQKFGFAGKDIRTIAGDVAAGSGASFEEISGYIGRFASGATGEAIARFQELGIVTREQLTQMGVQFDKSGSLVSPLPQAMNAVLTSMKQKYGGMMDAQSKTFEGMMSNLSDWKDQTLRTIGAPIFEVLKGKLSSVLDFLDSDQAKTALNGFANGVAAGVGQAMDWLEGTGIPRAQEAFGRLVALWNDVKSQWETGGAAGVAGGLLTALGLDEGLVTRAQDIISRVADAMFLFLNRDEWSSSTGETAGGILSALGLDPAAADRVAGVIDAVIGAVSGGIARAQQLFATFQTGGAFGLLTTLGLDPQLVGQVALIFGQVVQSVATGAAGFMAAIQPLQPVLQETWSIIQAQVLPALQTLAQFVGVALVGSFVALVGFVSGAMPGLGAAVVTAAETINAALSLVSNLIQLTVGVALKLIQGDWQGAWTLAQTSVAGARDAIGGILTGLRDTAINLVTAAKDGVIGLFRQLAEAINTTTQGGVDKVVEWFRGLPGRAADALRAGLGTVQKAASDLAQGAVDAFLRLVDQARDAGAGMVRAFTDGIRSRIDSFIAGVEDMVQKARDLLPGSDAKEGPLSDLTASGRALWETFATGMKLGEPDALAATAATVASIRAHMDDLRGVADVMRDAIRAVAPYGRSLGNERGYLQDLSSAAGSVASIAQAAARLQELFADRDGWGDANAMREWARGLSSWLRVLVDELTPVARSVEANVLPTLTSLGQAIQSINQAAGQGSAGQGNYGGGSGGSRGGDGATAAGRPRYSGFGSSPMEGIVSRAAPVEAAPVQPQPIAITINATVSSDLDMEILAQRVATIVNGRRRG